MYEERLLHAVSIRDDRVHFAADSQYVDCIHLFPDLPRRRYPISLQYIQIPSKVFQVAKTDPQHLSIRLGGEAFCTPRSVVG